MPTRLLIAYLLMALLGSGLAGMIWWAIYNSPQRKMRRHYRARREREKP